MSRQTQSEWYQERVEELREARDQWLEAEDAEKEASEELKQFDLETDEVEARLEERLKKLLEERREWVERRWAMRETRRLLAQGWYDASRKLWRRQLDLSMELVKFEQSRMLSDLQREDGLER